MRRRFNLRDESGEEIPYKTEHKVFRLLLAAARFGSRHKWRGFIESMAEEGSPFLCVSSFELIHSEP